MNDIYYRTHLIKLFKTLFLNMSNGKDKLLFYKFDIRILNASTENQPENTKEKLREINSIIELNDFSDEDVLNILEFFFLEYHRVLGLE